MIARRLVATLSVVATVLSFSAASASASTLTWTGANNQDWTQPANWAGGAVGEFPENGDSVIIPGEKLGGGQVVIDNVTSTSLIDFTVQSADDEGELPQQIDGSGTLTISDDLDITGGNFGRPAGDDEDENPITGIASPSFVLTGSASGAIDVDSDDHIPTFGGGSLTIADGAELSVRSVISSSYFDAFSDEGDLEERRRFTIYNEGTLGGFPAGNVSVELRWVNLDNSGTLATTTDATIAATESSILTLRAGTQITGSGSLAGEFRTDVQTDLTIPSGAQLYSTGSSSSLDLDGHTISGSGRTFVHRRVQGPGTISTELTLGTSGAGGGILTADQPLVLAGATHMAGRFSVTGTVENRGTMDFAYFDDGDGGSLRTGFFRDYFNLDPAFVNTASGTLNVTGGAYAELDLPSLTSAGTINVTSGQLRGGVERTLTSIGTITNADTILSLDLVIENGTLTSPGLVAGNVSVTGGTLALGEDGLSADDVTLGPDATVTSKVFPDDGFALGQIRGADVELDGTLVIDRNETTLTNVQQNGVRVAQASGELTGAFDLISFGADDATPNFWVLNKVETDAFVKYFTGTSALDKSAVAAGDSVTVTGSGYPANAPVTIIYSGGASGGALSAATADGAGNVSKTVTIPETFTAGTIQVGIAVDGTLTRITKSLAVTAKSVVTTPPVTTKPIDTTPPIKTILPINFVGKGTKADKVVGTTKDDKIKTGRGNDTVKSGAGNDVVDGGAGNDKLDGGAGNDKLTGGSGNDSMSGGAGNDKLFAKDGANGDKITCGPGKDVVYADAKDKVSKDCEKVVRTRTAGR